MEQVKISEKTRQELQERFALIYTGQRRLARNLLRDVVGNYIGGRQESVQALEEMQRVAVLMKFELERAIWTNSPNTEPTLGDIQAAGRRMFQYLH